MNELMPWLYGVLVVAVAALALWIVFRRRRPMVREDDYTKALELWLAGDLDGSRDRFRLAIDKDPHTIDPYLQLGDLLRQTGEARRAAILHRGLTVRRDVPRQKRVSITLSLAEDLLATKNWREVGEVLDTLKTVAATSARYWRARFDQCVGMANEQEAAQALRAAAHMCEDPSARIFSEQYAFFQADRALCSARENRAGEAKRLLKDIPSESPATAKANFVRALLAAQDGDAELAISLTTEGLIGTPEEIALFLPTLQEALLDSGRFARSLPILESACQTESAPPSMWIALALLYEKLGRREDAITLLVRKARDPRLTPNAAAPFLRLLAAEQADSDFGRVWGALSLPSTANSEWTCTSCGTNRMDIRWFCPVCHSFNSYTVDRRREETA